jgi:chemotaxis protein methyltransferase CheR
LTPEKSVDPRRNPKARTGLYSRLEVQRGLPVSLLVKYFQKTGSSWLVRPELRKRVNFHEHNLLDGSISTSP